MTTPDDLRRMAAEIRTIAEASRWAHKELKDARLIGAAVTYVELAMRNAELAAEALEERASHLEVTIARTPPWGS